MWISAVWGQSNLITIKGTVKDGSTALAGVSVKVKEKSTVATQTDANGRYSISAPANGHLVFSIVGYETKEIAINGDAEINVTLEMSSGQLDEVAVVAFGKQRKSTMVGAVTTINPKELKGPTSNLTTMLAGRVAGMIAYQRSGEPGRDNADFFIRGVNSFGTGKRNPLILVNGIETEPYEFSRVQPDDIASFSILKDATAAALFGARGANGVILVSTKSGFEGKTKFNIRYENSLSSNTRNFKFADNVTYMKLMNEASLTRYPQQAPVFTREEIDKRIQGADPSLYPSNDWMGLMIKDNTLNSRLNANVSGGGSKATYYLSGTANVDNGILKTIDLNGFNTNVKARNFELRSDVTFKATPTTDIKVRTTGQFSDYNGPIGGGAEIFNRILYANPVMFPAIYPREFSPNVKHPLFGNKFVNGQPGVFYNQPYAYALSGYSQTNTSFVLAQLEINQDLNFITEGLKARVMAYTKRQSYFGLGRSNRPFYYSAIIDPEEGFRGLQYLNEGQGSEWLVYNPGDKTINTFNWIEGAINYDKTIAEKHNIGAMLVGYMSNYLEGNATKDGEPSLERSLPRRNLSLSGRFTYGYDSRYLLEFNFGYNGSERFYKTNRFGFFPSIGVAWNAAEEKFLRGLKDSGGRLKLRASYGLVGNDQIGDTDERFYYMSIVNMNDAGRGYSFGTNFEESRSGISVNRFANNQITWEKAYKTNLGLELGLFNSFNMELDFFRERRTNILELRETIPNSMGLPAAMKANIGEVQGQGLDATLDYSKSFMNNSFLTLKGTFTYAKNKIIKREDINYPAGTFKSRIGYPINQRFGLIAERYFVDDEEVSNSPKQEFGNNYGAGDLKYRDVNGDGRITLLDEVPIGYPEVPEIIYGFGFTYGYKGFDISAFAQGSARSSFWIRPFDIAPFLFNTKEKIPNGQTGLLQAIADSHWSEENRDLYAFYPRLSLESISNNYQTSTWWMRNGAFLRVKSVELGYRLPDKLMQRYKINNLRVYANGLNLFAISKFKMWDVEMGGQGVGYPIQRVFNLGVQIGF
ncbi:TonB-dependent receptor [Sphingobacterium puteale]|uniref:TonB-dependent receptor n=2 Tax=Sphingobacterium puteale TaxID=2420510 RepID=A0A420W563_9SPHI|nr:TonB-dependent receptor [Sphingobacterium puteale]